MEQCTDVLEIACWNGEIVQVGFALDCHDREVLARVAVPRNFLGTDVQLLMQRAVAARFGSGERPNQPIQWLSDNGSVYMEFPQYRGQLGAAVDFPRYRGQLGAAA